MTNLLDWVIRDLWLFLPTKIPILAGVVIGCIDKLWITTKHGIKRSNFLKDKTILAHLPYYLHKMNECLVLVSKHVTSTHAFYLCN